MSSATVYTCDRDGCHATQDGGRAVLMTGEGWVTVWAAQMMTERHFCGLYCLALWAIEQTGGADGVQAERGA